MRDNNDILDPGTMLFEYRVLESVGGGHWSYVYKAQHPKLPMLVAIKQLKPEWAQDEEALQRFSREADIVARINHPNVMQIFDLKYSEETGSHYIITEFAEQGSLADRLAQSREGLLIDEVLHLALSICSGLEAVHRQHIIHRDIKPSNILLFDVGEDRDIPKLADFGIARAPATTGASVPSSSVVYGTLAYMSPEQLDQNITVDHRSDLYSLGILLYELLTGRVPFTGDQSDIFYAHSYESPTPPRELRSDISSEFEQIVLRALRKDREDRYQSAADMHEALKAIGDIPTRGERRLKFEVLLEQGLAHLQREEWEKAIEALRQADITQPGDERVQAGLQRAREQQRLKRLYELGTHYLEEGQWEQAREYLAELWSLDPDYSDGQIKGQLDQATQGLERERGQRELGIQYLKGMGYFRKWQWSQAIAELEHVVSEDPDFKDAADRLAEARQYVHAERQYQQAQRHQELEEWEQAVYLLEEVERLRPPHINVTGSLQTARGKWAAARAERQFASWYAAGLAHLAAGELEQARDSFERIASRRPDYRDAAERLEEIEARTRLERLFSQAHEHETQVECEQAILIYKQILDIDPYDRKASRLLARAQRHARRGEITGFRRTVVTAQNWWEDRDNRMKAALIAVLAIIVLALCGTTAWSAGLLSWNGSAATPTEPPEVETAKAATVTTEAILTAKASTADAAIAIAAANSTATAEAIQTAGTATATAGTATAAAESTATADAVQIATAVKATTEAESTATAQARVTSSAATAEAAATIQSRATGTAQRAATLTAAVTDTPTPRPRPTDTSPPAYPPPVLEGIDVIGCNVTFKWIWPGILAEDEWFAVRVGKEEPHSVIWVKENTHTHPFSEPGEYLWEIAICRGDPAQSVCEQLAVSERGFFVIGGTPSGSSPTPPPPTPP